MIANRYIFFVCICILTCKFCSLLFLLLLFCCNRNKTSLIIFFSRLLHLTTIFYAYIYFSLLVCEKDKKKVSMETRKIKVPRGRMTQSNSTREKKLII